MVKLDKMLLSIDIAIYDLDLSKDVNRITYHSLCHSSDKLFFCLCGLF